VRQPDNPTLIFDTDGTLVDARSAVVDAVCEALTDTYGHFLLPSPPPARERVCAAMGLPAPEFFRACFAPDSVPPAVQAAFAAEFEVRSLRAEVAALRRGAGRLYDGVEETLARLREQGHRLVLFSNAAEPYFRAVVDVYDLDRYFAQTLSLEAAVSRRLARHKAGMARYLAQGAPSVVVGDRVHDIDAGRAAGARTVGCLYGFGVPGEFQDADWQITAPVDLLGLPLSAPADAA
jgi:phosphoglycolate phosphatase